MAPISLFIAFYSSLAKSLLSLVFARLYTPQNPPSRDLTGQVAIVTGANSGIGLSIATALAKQGATVYLACRNLERGDAAVDEIAARVGEKGQRRIFCWQLDIGELESVKSFCGRWRRDGKRIDMLVHNAGIAGPSAGGATTTKEGLDLVYATNFLGSFLMTHLLEGNLSETARVVFTSSTGSYSGGSVLQSRTAAEAKTGVFALARKAISHGITFVQTQLGSTNSAPAYALSKAQQVLLARLLQRHFLSTPDNRRTAHAFTPGFTSTPIFGKFDYSWKTWLTNPLFATLKVTENWIAVDTDEGAKTGAWLASSGEDVEGGGYWERMTRRTSLIDLLNGAMGDAAFKRGCKEQWKGWERDAGVDWDVRM